MRHPGTRALLPLSGWHTNKSTVLLSGGPQDKGSHDSTPACMGTRSGEASSISLSSSATTAQGSGASPRPPSVRRPAPDVASVRRRGCSAPRESMVGSARACQGLDPTQKGGAGGRGGSAGSFRRGQVGGQLAGATFTLRTVQRATPVAKEGRPARRRRSDAGACAGRKTRDAIRWDRRGEGRMVNPMAVACVSVGQGSSEFGDAPA